MSLSLPSLASERPIYACLYVLSHCANVINGKLTSRDHANEITAVCVFCLCKYAADIIVGKLIFMGLYH
jgi:hypothetical protein